MAGGYKKQGYAWAVSAGLNAALAAISAKFFQPQVISAASPIALQSLQIFFGKIGTKFPN